MKVFVIDASIVVSFLLGENPNVSEKLAGLLRKAEDDKLEIVSTSLLALEVGNGIRFSLKEKSLAEDVLKKFVRLPIKYSSLTKTQIQKSVSVSYDLGTSVYDTSYHILAIAKGAIFLTCDDKYFQKARKLGSVELID